MRDKNRCSPARAVWLHEVRRKWQSCHLRRIHIYICACVRLFGNDARFSTHPCFSLSFSRILSIAPTLLRGGRGDTARAFRARYMLRVTLRPLGGQRRWWKEGRPDFARANERRMRLEQRRIDASRYHAPVEPTPQQACELYRQLLKA
ncbi:hypothetical protein DQ04_06221000, partial [Trypanosoma grayi]|uniref:hypothetical protein n=1 Tax=Trypanosoma grayi TaxID=71804 RepID=UPI0004F4AA1A